MNFKEYCEQKSPKRLPSFSVELNTIDVFGVYERFNGKTVDLVFQGEHMTFLIPRGSTNGGMYTMDQDGNKKHASVFRLIPDSNVFCKGLLNGKYK